MAPKVRKVGLATPRAGTNESPTPAPSSNRNSVTAVPTTAPANVELQEKRCRKSFPAVPNSSTTTAIKLPQVVRGPAKTTQQLRLFQPRLAVINLVALASLGDGYCRSPGRTRLPNLEALRRKR